MRHLVLVLGDQLDRDAAAFDDFDPAHDAIWMSETPEETDYVWSHKLRIALFLSAMRHFRDELQGRGWTVHYRELAAQPRDDEGRSFAELLAIDVRRLKPGRVIVVEPGDHRVLTQLQDAAKTLRVPLEIRTDRHFYDTTAQFEKFAAGKKSLLLEHYYRHMRRTHKVLITDKGEPEGGAWNFDHDNRESFGRQGPRQRLSPRTFPSDQTTRDVIALVRVRFASHPGSLDEWTLPVTRDEALGLLDDFIEQRLCHFGAHEDAMWREQPFLYHSRLSTSLNLKLISPRECVDRAAAAYHAGRAPINSVEGFIRQILGWREFVRGLYWLYMPGYARKNHFRHQHELPHFYWTGETDMACVQDTMQHVLQHAYAHHIHRLMVLGNLALTSGTKPQAFQAWHMAMYADAIDWVSLPNALGMSQFGDGGIIGTKPYVSTGAYVQRMSNFCQGCRYDPKQATGEDACPLTTFYWDFLSRHADELRQNPRMMMQVKNLDRKTEDEVRAIRVHARALRAQWQAEAEAAGFVPPGAGRQGEE